MWPQDLLVDTTYPSLHFLLSLFENFSFYTETTRSSRGPHIPILTVFPSPLENFFYHEATIWPRDLLVVTTYPSLHLFLTLLKTINSYHDSYCSHHDYGKISWASINHLDKFIIHHETTRSSRGPHIPILTFFPSPHENSFFTMRPQDLLVDPTYPFEKFFLTLLRYKVVHIITMKNIMGVLKIYNPPWDHEIFSWTLPTHLYTYSYASLKTLVSTQRPRDLLVDPTYPSVHLFLTLLKILIPTIRARDLLVDPTYPPERTPPTHLYTYY